MQLVTPLSFSQHNHQSLTTLVEQALISLECPQDKLTGFQDHASIHLEFDNLPNISISVEYDRLWLWSAFTDLTSTLCTNHASELFTLLQLPIPNIELGQAILIEAKQGYELKALVDPACLHSPQNLGSIIEYFHQKVDGLCQIFNQKI